MAHDINVLQIYCPNYRAEFNWLPDDCFEVENVVPDYRVSAKVLYYDDTNKVLKFLLPKTYWNMVNLDPGMYVLPIYWILHNKKEYMMYTKHAYNAEQYLESTDKLGIKKKTTYRLGVWFRHLIEIYLGRTRAQEYRRYALKGLEVNYKPKIESIVNDLFDNYHEGV